MGIQGGQGSGKSLFEGVYVIAKFYYSKAPDGTSKLISRSLGKFGILDRVAVKSREVDNKDVWLSRIAGEIYPGKNHGAFLLSPVTKIEDPDTQLLKLIPGFFSVVARGSTALLTPNSDPDKYWILSHGTRKIFSHKYHTMVVPISYAAAEEATLESENQEIGRV